MGWEDEAEDLGASPWVDESEDLGPAPTPAPRQDRRGFRRDPLPPSPFGILGSEVGHGIARLIPDFDIPRDVAFGAMGRTPVGRGFARLLGMNAQEDVPVRPEAIAEGAANMTNFGLSDELRGVSEAAGGEDYTAARDEARRYETDVAERNPGNYMAGQGIALLAQLPAPGAGEVAAGRMAAPLIARGAAPAAVRYAPRVAAARAAGATGEAGLYGLLAGAGASEGETTGEIVEDALTTGGISAGIQAPLSLLSARLGRGAQRQAERTAENLTYNRLGQAGIRDRAHAREVMVHPGAEEAASVLEREGAFGPLGMSTERRVLERVRQQAVDPGTGLPPTGMAGAGQRVSETRAQLSQAGATVDMEQVAQNMLLHADDLAQTSGRQGEAEALRRLVHQEIFPRNPMTNQPSVPRLQTLEQAQNVRRAIFEHMKGERRTGQSRLGAQTPLSDATWQKAYHHVSQAIDDQIGQRSPELLSRYRADQQMADVALQLEGAQEHRMVGEQMTNRVMGLTSSIAGMGMMGAGVAGDQLDPTTRVGLFILGGLLNRGLRSREHAARSTANQAALNFLRSTLETSPIRDRLIAAARRGPIALAAASYLEQRRSPEYRQMLEQAREMADSEEPDE